MSHMVNQLYMLLLLPAVLSSTNKGILGLLNQQSNILLKDKHLLTKEKKVKPAINLDFCLYFLFNINMQRMIIIGFVFQINISFLIH